MSPRPIAASGGGAGDVSPHGDAPLVNWAGNLAYRARALHRPGSVDAVRELVARGARARTPLKALGTRHSFSDVADTTGDLVSLERLDRVLALDPVRRTVTVEGGIRYGALCAHLADAGWALHNLASLPHISVAGACATGTHGSGDRNAGLASAVTALELVTADGDLLTLSRDDGDPRFAGAVVSLGALGLVTRLTLEVRPTFDLVQHVWEGLPFADLVADLDAIVGDAYSASVFTRWTGTRVDQVWLKRVHAPGTPPADPPALRGALLADDHRHPIAGLSAVHCTAQRGEPGAWHARLPHFRMDFTPSSGAELQSDWLVPREHARAALLALDAMHDRIAPLVQVSELRTVAADDLWLSPAHERDCLSIHFTWVPDGPAVRALLPHLEAVLAPFHARPHWGKLFATPPARLAALYPRMADFAALRAALDPHGRFDNAYLATHLPRVAPVGRAGPA